MNHDYSALPRPLPQLSDEAAVEILEFLHRLIDAFEAVYGDQIRRHYQDLEYACNSAPAADTDTDNPPF